MNKKTLLTVLLLQTWMAHAEPIESCRPAAWRQAAANHAFAEHERLSFVVHWGLVKAGKAILAVEGVETIQGRPAYHLSMDIHSAGVTSAFHHYSDRTDSWLDRESLTTLRYLKRVREGRYQDDETVDFDPPCQRFQKKENRIDKQMITSLEGRILPDTLDTYGALFYLRTLPLAVGEHYDIELFTGDKVLSVTAIVKKKERIKTAAGKFDCFLVEPTVRDHSVAGGKLKQIQWWYTTDERHLPIRIRMEVKVGHIAADLTP